MTENNEQHKELFYAHVRDLPHRGRGLNNALVGVCNTGINAGLRPDEIAAAIQIERGAELKPGELDRAISRAIEGKGTYTPAALPPPRRTRAQKNREAIAASEDKRAELNRRIIEAGSGEIEPDAPELWEASEPRPQGWKEIQGMPGSEALPDILAYLKNFYSEGDFLYIGSGKESQAAQPGHVKTAQKWYDFFKGEILAAYSEPPERARKRIERLGELYPYTIPNPLTGERGENGSLRADSCVKDFRFMLVESDTLPINKQIPLFCGLHLPVFTLTYTGGKSIHALTNAAHLAGHPIKDLAEWKNTIKTGLFKGALLNVELDHTTSNAARLSRTPGMYRPDKGKFQRTIYNNTKGVDLWQKINKYLELTPPKS